MKILGISGSLRKDSYNTALLNTARRLMEHAAALESFDLTGVPFYNADIDGDIKPEPVQALKEAISGADALLFATPEYNYSIPGVLKNAIDWASRPAYQSVLAGKPAGIISASVSILGGARAQVHLRDVLSGTLTPVFQAPHCLFPQAKNLFAAAGSLADEGAQERLKTYLDSFSEWLKKLETN